MRLAVLVAALTGLLLVSVAGDESVDRPGPGGRRAARDRVGDDVRPHDRGRRLHQPQTSPLVLTSGMTLVGAAVLLPCLALVDGPRVTTDPAALAWLRYLGALTMALAYVLLYSGLRVVAPSTAVTASLVEPVTAAVVAAVVLRRVARARSRSSGSCWSSARSPGSAGPARRRDRCCRTPEARLGVLHVRRSTQSTSMLCRCRRRRRARARRPCWTAAGGRGRRCRAPAAGRG